MLHFYYFVLESSAVWNQLYLLLCVSPVLTAYTDRSPQPHTGWRVSWRRGVHTVLRGSLGNGLHTFSVSSRSPVWLSHESCAKNEGREWGWMMQTQWAKANIKSETKGTPLVSQGGQCFHYLREVVLTGGLFRPIRKLGLWVTIKDPEVHLFSGEGC